MGNSGNAQCSCLVSHEDVLTSHELITGRRNNTTNIPYGTRWKWEWVGGAFEVEFMKTGVLYCALYPRNGTWELEHDNDVLTIDWRDLGVYVMTVDTMNQKMSGSYKGFPRSWRKASLIGDAKVARIHTPEQEALEEWEDDDPYLKSSSLNDTTAIQQGELDKHEAQVAAVVDTTPHRDAGVPNNLEAEAAAAVQTPRHRTPGGDTPPDRAAGPPPKKVGGG